MLSFLYLLPFLEAKYLELPCQNTRCLLLRSSLSITTSTVSKALEPTPFLLHSTLSTRSRVVVTRDGPRES